MSDYIPLANSFASPSDSSNQPIVSAGRILPAGSNADPLHDEPLHDEPLHWEDLSVGQVWNSPLRQITEDDVRSFAILTGDDDPLHVSSASDSPFGRPVAHGLLGLSVLAGLGVDHPRAATLALVGISDWQFNNPIYFGQWVHVETSVEQTQPHGRRAGRVVWFRRLISDEGRTLQQGRFITLVATRHRSMRQPR